MAEKFRKIVNAPHRAAGRAREAIRNIHTTSDAGCAAQIGGATAMGVAEFLLWATKYVTLDNHLLRRMEEWLRGMQVGRNASGADKKISAWVKKNPNLAAHAIYYAFVGMVAGGVKVADVVRDGESAAIENVAADAAANAMLDPAAPDFIDRCVALENALSIPIVYTETYRATPVVQRMENVWTHGFGMTWSRDGDGCMTVRDYADTPANRRKEYVPHKPQAVRSMDADMEETQQFLRDHIYPKIQKNMTRPMTVGEFMGVCVAGYQLEGHVGEICRQLSRAKTPQQVADAFVTPTMYNYGGTTKRRWVCAMLAAGYITLNDVLNADIDAFYLAKESVFIRNGHFLCDANTVSYVMGLRRKKKTRDVVAQLGDGCDAMAKLGQFGPMARTLAVGESKEIQAISDAVGLMQRGDEAYRNKNYAGAAELYTQAVAKDPGSMEAVSSLALCYKRLGDERRSVADYRRAIDVVRDCIGRGRENPALFDSEVKGALYFNAASAYEAIGNIQAASNDAAAAAESYERARKNYEIALQAARQYGLGARREKIYSDALMRMQNRVRNKRVSFNSSIKNIENNAHSDDFMRGVAMNKTYQA